MNWHRYIALLVLTAFGMVAVGEILSETPPPSIVECDAAYPDGIIGTWRSDPIWTREERDKAQLDNAEALTHMSTHIDASPGRGTTTFTANTLISETPQLGEIERNYRIIGGSENRYVLELSDQFGATSTSVINIELVPCGLVMESRSVCDDDFCQNALEETLRMAAGKSDSRVSDDELKHQLELTLQVLAEQPQEIVRTYYRQVVSEKTQPPGTSSH